MGMSNSDKQGDLFISIHTTEDLRGPVYHLNRTCRTVRGTDSASPAKRCLEE